MELLLENPNLDHFLRCRSLGNLIFMPEQFEANDPFIMRMADHV